MIQLTKEAMLRLIGEIVARNQKLLDTVGGDQGAVVDGIVTLPYLEYSIWNPLYDESLRFPVDPFDYYGETQIKRFIDTYRERT